MFNILFVIIILFFNKFENVITLIKFRELNCFRVIASRVKKLKKIINFLKISIIKLFLNIF